MYSVLTIILTLLSISAFRLLYFPIGFRDNIVAPNFGQSNIFFTFKLFNFESEREREREREKTK
jgi:hypothetical protein